MNEPPTMPLSRGVVVLTKKTKVGFTPVHYMNRKQAEHKLSALGEGWFIAGNCPYILCKTEGE